MLSSCRKCRQCGEPLPPYREHYSPYCGPACSTVVVADEVRQLRAKQGPHYDRWRAGMLRAAGEPPAADR